MHTLTARLHHPGAGAKYHDCYCYDDAFTTAEPLIHETTATIQYLLSCHPRYRNDKHLYEPEVIQLQFTASPPEHWPNEGIVCELNFLRQEDDFSIYAVSIAGPEDAADEFSARGLFVSDPLAPLCPHLLDYFPEPPERFYCQITPMPA